MALVHKLGWDAQFTQRSPWFWPLSAAAERFASLADWPDRAQLTAAYEALALPHGAEPLRFGENVRKEERYTDAGAIVVERLYDGRITRTGEVPTRERDWHDFFNALCFMTFPLAKRALHRRQFQVMSRRVGPGALRLPIARTAEQDALTLFDEGGAVIAAEAVACQPLADAADSERPALLREFVAERRARVLPFGHALFEHLVEGLRCPGGSTRLVQVADVTVPDRQLVAAVDRGLAKLLSDARVFMEPREGAHLRLPELGLAQ